MDIETLRSIESALERAKLANVEQERLQKTSIEVSRIRREAVEELLSSGMTQAAVAGALGMSRGRVNQLVSSGPPPERLFFGDGDVVVAMGAKLEAEKDNPGQVLAEEDLRSFTALSRLLKGLRLDAEHELIPPPGFVNLNRDNLIVVCGPRLSPILEQILESDPYLGFAKDDEGWYLLNKETGEAFRSPQDRGSHGDAAYFGKLPRPDGRGLFLYAAGIHAGGPAGVVHYLEGNLGRLYKEVKDKRFSVLVECEWDPVSCAVTESRLLSPLYLHKG